VNGAPRSRSAGPAAPGAAAGSPAAPSTAPAAVESAEAGDLRVRADGLLDHGPSPAWKSKGMPSGANGISRSEKRIAASKPST